MKGRITKTKVVRSKRIYLKREEEIEVLCRKGKRGGGEFYHSRWTRMQRRLYIYKAKS